MDAKPYRCGARRFPDQAAAVAHAAAAFARTGVVLGVEFRPRYSRAALLAELTALGVSASYDRASARYRVAPYLGPLPGGRGFQAQHRAQVEAGALYFGEADKLDALTYARQLAAKGQARQP
jgi:hypothetical protein